MARRANVTMSGERAIRIERIFDAPRERVWKAMTQPELLAQWWGRGNKLTIEKLEVKKGGHWRFVEHTDHGSFGFEGRFREVDAAKFFMEQTFEFDGMPGHVAVQSLTLEEIEPGKTRMVATSTFFTAEDRDGMVQSGMEGGMNQSYEALDRVLAAQGSM